MSAAISTASLPPFALLDRYTGANGYTDCFVADVPGEFTHAEFVAAFYTTWLFRLERVILKWLVARPSTDDEARQLAQGERDAFAAWTVEARAPNQLLMCDFLENTRSWLMVEQHAGGGATRLYFGSAIVARANARTGRRRLGLRFRALLGFHRRYSRALLRAAGTRLTSGLA